VWWSLPTWTTRLPSSQRSTPPTDRDASAVGSLIGPCVSTVEELLAPPTVDLRRAQVRAREGRESQIDTSIRSARRNTSEEGKERREDDGRAGAAAAARGAEAAEGDGGGGRERVQRLRPGVGAAEHGAHAGPSAAAAPRAAARPRRIRLRRLLRHPSYVTPPSLSPLFTLYPTDPEISKQGITRFSVFGCFFLGRDR
jgi:hypothetical protein